MNVNLFTTFAPYTNRAKSISQDEVYCLKRNLLAGFNSVNIVTYYEAEMDFAASLVMGAVNDQECRTKVSLRYVNSGFGQLMRPGVNSFISDMNKPQFNNSINVLCQSSVYFNRVAVSDFSKFKGAGMVRFANPTPLSDFSDYPSVVVFVGSPKFRIQSHFSLGQYGWVGSIMSEAHKVGLGVVNLGKKKFIYSYR